jgi:RNA polymerase sigma factor (sigma-70 family)
MSLAGMTMGAECTADVTAPPDRDEAVADDALVAAVRRGDDRAFEGLYERYQRRIAAYVYGMVGDHGRAEDVTQEVFISALRRMRATERPIAFKPWIYEIAKNACIDQFRRSRRTEEVSFDVADDAGAVEAARLTAPAPTPHAAVESKQRLDDLCGAFGGLSDTHHEILVMRELEGLSYREIGDRLNMSRPSVESTLFRARRRLGEEYDELVSGARCISVQSLLASGSTGTGSRDQRRLARHIAHCQPCRREAHAAGVDIQTLPQAIRTLSVRRVAALLPFPALLRLRRGGSVDQWTGQAQSYAEPAVGWGKAAAAAAAVLVAGGAGVVGHDEATHPIRDAKPAAATSPAGTGTSARPAQASSSAPVRGISTASRDLARTARIERLAGRGVVVHLPAAGDRRSAQHKQSASRPVKVAPRGDGTSVPEAIAPSAAGSGGSRSTTGPSTPGELRSPGPGGGGPVDAAAPTRSTLAATLDQPLQEAQGLATKADGSLGQAVGDVRRLIAPTG